MAKDGSNRGGARAGAGRKPKAAKEKIAEGRKTKVLDFADAPVLEGVEMPPPHEFMKEQQRDGSVLQAEEIYKNTWSWLAERGCDKAVSPQLIEQYAMSVARWIHCEEALSKMGYLAKHPTTGAPIASPYVAMSQSFMKQANSAWYQIFQIVKEQCTQDYSGLNPMDDAMERLLSARKL